MRGRSASNPPAPEGGEKVVCYGVSQGCYAIKSVVMGTSSLGSCFALIARKGQQVFFAHVQAGTDIKATVTLIKEELSGVSTVFVVRGVGFSDTTEKQITELKNAFTVVESGSKTACVVFDPEVQQPTTPGDIAPINNKKYLGGNLLGGSQKKGAPLLAMSD